LAEFYDVSGQISIAAFRINPTIALTSLPVILASGAPVIGGGASSGGGGGGGSGPLPQYSELVFSNFTSNSAGVAGVTVDTPMPGSAFGFGDVGGTAALGSSPLNYTAQWSNVVLNSSTLTFTALATSASEMFDTNGNYAAITSGTMTISLGAGLTGNNNVTTGTASGSLTLVSSIGSVSGSFTANYTAQ
jgi:hypothetical protein